MDQNNNILENFEVVQVNGLETFEGWLIPILGLIGFFTLILIGIQILQLMFKLLQLITLILILLSIQVLKIIKDVCTTIFGGCFNNLHIIIIIEYFNDWILLTLNVSTYFEIQN
jgi:hypothetical protein